jgi:putative tryptophan/tyrosine transport system substrate-binding protein
MTGLVLCSKGGEAVQAIGVRELLCVTGECGRMKIDIKRRRIVTLLGGVAILWAAIPRAQPAGRTPLVGFLMGLADDKEAQTRIKAFEGSLGKLGWVVGHDVHIEYRFAAADADRMRSFAQELVALRPDVIVGHSTPVVTELVRATRTIPIVSVVVADPVGSGFAESIARPGGNVTGFTNLNPTIPGKLLTILQQIMPKLAHVALLYNPDSVAHGSLAREYFQSFDIAASAFAVRATQAEVHSPSEIEQTMQGLAREPGSGLIVMPDNFTAVHRQIIISLAADLRVPAIYAYRFFVEEGGLISYGVDVVDLFRRAPEYVSRILRGANPADLPIQAPTKFELAINLKTAKALGLLIPKILLAGADALIE